jgi:hypothetical protein
VANLNASSLNGANFASPGAIGGTTPGSGAFTTLSSTGVTSLGNAGGAYVNILTGAIVAAGSNLTNDNIILRGKGTGTVLLSYNDGTGGTQFFNGLTGLVGGVDTSGNATFNGKIVSSGSTSGIGYATGSGGTVTQATSRTTGVTLNNITGAITLVSAAGTTSWQTFTVTDSACAATDVPHAIQKSGTDIYNVIAHHPAAGSFQISFQTTGGTTTEQPVFQFVIIKGSNS